MKEYFAERELLYSLKGDSNRNRCTIKVSAPVFIESGSVNFEFHQGAAACKIEISGLPERFVEEVYGADSIQALALAADVDPYLKFLVKKYDFYWLTGEPYFD